MAFRKRLSCWEDNLRHAHVLVYYDREIIIIDPDYTESTAPYRRVQGFVGLGLVRGLLDFMTEEKKKRRQEGSTVVVEPSLV